MNVHRELRQLIQRADNRRCADCSVALTAPEAMFVSLRFGAFLCVECSQVHRGLGIHHTTVRSVVHDAWDGAALAGVQGGNTQCNGVYEHFVPESWRDLKPQPGADQEHRRHWIEHKYVHRLFLLPNLTAEPDDLGPGRKPGGRQDPLRLPIRFADCFVVVGPGEMAEVMPDEGYVHAEPEDISFVPTVTDCYPPPAEDPSRAPPEHLAQFVTPGALTLQRREKPPTAFSFVLTGVTSVKQHGVALVVWEEKDVMAVAPLFDHVPKELQPEWLTAPRDYVNLVFVPKVLVLLSHYPFYAVFQEFLAQLYRISLSTAPLPLERYIASFVSEVPLPPQGQIEVHYPLPDRTLRIARPPRNQLPMANFSYRPLFASLSLNHVLDVFGCLLLEVRVAVFSRYVSILTPVCEALLSLLFPFDWQGAFIPVIPDEMIDMLEAPVPFLLGCRRSYLDDTPERLWAEGVVMVDLDRDEVHLGLDEDTREPRLRPEIPSKEARKLKEALREHAAPAYGAIERGRRQRLAETAGRLSPSHIAAQVDEAEEDDYLGPDGVFPDHGIMPIINWAHDQGMSSTSKSRFVMKRSRSRKSSSRTDLAPLAGPHWDAGRSHILEASANETPEDMGGDGFSAEGIRNAFLRFFTSTFREYTRYILPAPRGPAGSPAQVQRLFDREAFIAASSHLNGDSHGWMRTMLQSQLFERFLEERSVDPDRPEIRFFDESILQKLNRSVATRVKHATPFLDDMENESRETFTCQPPSPYGLAAGSEFSYIHGFPSLLSTRFGVVRQPRRLFKVPEQLRRKRLRARRGPAHESMSGQSVEQMVQTSVANARSRVRGRSRASDGRLSEYSMISRESADSPLAPGVSVDRLLVAIVALQAVLRRHLALKRVRRMQGAAGIIQAHFRAWKAGERARMNWAEMHDYVVLIQRTCRAFVARRRSVRRRDAILTLQTQVRGALRRRRYLRMRDAAIRIQAAERARRAHEAFTVVRALIVRIQACFRGFIHRKVSLRKRKRLLHIMRRLLYKLWIRAHTPLRDRSKFWLLFQGSSMLDLALHHQELERLANILGIGNARPQPRNPHFSYSKQMIAVERWLHDDSLGDSVSDLRTQYELSRLDLVGIGTGKASWEEDAEDELKEGRVRGRGSSAASMRPNIRDSGTSSVGETPFSVATLDAPAERHLDVARAHEALERKELYERLKKGTNDGTRFSFFQLFRLESTKKRKRTLAEIIWSDDPRAGAGRADASAEVVMGTFDGDMRTRDWVEELRAQRIRKDVLTTVQACLLTIKEQRRPETRADRNRRWSSARVLRPRTSVASVGRSTVPASPPMPLARWREESSSNPLEVLGL